MNAATRMTVTLGAVFAVMASFAAAPTPPAAQTRGAELLKPFKQRLMSALQDGMRKGPAEAIESCSVEAPRIAASLSGQGVRMGRTSHRLRNPANKAPEWVEPVLENYLAGRGPVEPVTVPSGERRVGYVEPIRVKPLCLGCHGTELAPGVAERIERLYPEDRATGFEEGDLRGVFWVEYPAD